MEAPLISIITPSFNQAHFLEQTIQSVLDQSYGHVEYIIFDGGSQDNSADIIRRYAKHLAYWTSEPDRGQSHAINKGFARATGEIVAWINSDDYYLPDAFAYAVETLADHPDVAIVYAQCNMVDEDNGTSSLIGRPTTLSDLAGGSSGIPQPSVFMRRETIKRAGPLREDLHYTMDWDYWTQIARWGRLHYVPNQVWATYRLYATSKTGSNSIAGALELFRGVEDFWNGSGVDSVGDSTRSRAVASMHLACAQRYYANQQLAAAQHHIRQAARANWGLLLSPDWYGKLARASVGPQRVGAVKRAWRHSMHALHVGNSDA